MGMHVSCMHTYLYVRTRGQRACNLQLVTMCVKEGYNPDTLSSPTMYPIRLFENWWGASVGVVMETKTFPRQTHAHLACSQREMQPRFPGGHSGTLSPSQQKPDSSLPPQNHSCLQVPHPLPRTLAPGDFSPDPAAGRGSSSPWMGPADRVGRHSALGTGDIWGEGVRYSSLHREANSKAEG